MDQRSKRALLRSFSVDDRRAVLAYRPLRLVELWADDGLTYVQAARVFQMTAMRAESDIDDALKRLESSAHT